MAEEYPTSAAPQQYFSDVNTRVRDLEEKQRLLKDRTLLIGQNLVEDREEIFNELHELKKSILQIKEETTRMFDMFKPSSK
jgi:predicted  nucleic acid-binding Zn-ribbon protein